MSTAWNSRLGGSWKADERHIDWSVFDHHTIECALNYFYTGHYDPEKAGVELQSRIEQNNAAEETDVAGIAQGKSSLPSVTETYAVRILTTLARGRTLDITCSYCRFFGLFMQR